MPLTTAAGRNEDGEGNEVKFVDSSVSRDFCDSWEGQEQGAVCCRCPLKHSGCPNSTTVMPFDGSLDQCGLREKGFKPPDMLLSCPIP